MKESEKKFKYLKLYLSCYNKNKLLTYGKGKFILADYFKIG